MASVAMLTAAGMATSSVRLRGILWREQIMSDDRTIATGSEQLPVPTARRAVGLRSEGAVAVAATIAGAVALGALAIGQLALGRAKLGRGRIRELRITRLVIDELSVESVRGLNAADRFRPER